MRFLAVSFTILFLFIAGCAWISPKREIPEETSKYVQIGRIIDAERLNQGGTLVIVPFKAGVGVEANSTLDKIVLKIVKGISDQLKDNKPYFEILLADDVNDAEFVIEGRVTGVKDSSVFKRLLFRKKELELSAKGKMIDRTTGDIVLVFDYKRNSEHKDEDHYHLAYMVGKDIARLILSAND